jgi:hypothetical protein
MRTILATCAIAVLLAAPARADERPGDAALGALSGAVVFGPVGLVAGAVVGFTAGPAISQSWRRNRHHPRRVVGAKHPTRVAAKPRAGATSAHPEAGSVAPQSAAPGVGGPPAQGLE